MKAARIPGMSEDWLVVKKEDFDALQKLEGELRERAKNLRAADVEFRRCMEKGEESIAALERIRKHSASGLAVALFAAFAFGWSLHSLGIQLGWWLR